MMRYTSRAIWSGLAVGYIGLVFFSAQTAQARPEYAQKEAKSCLYCHLSASPGLVDPVAGKQEPTTRNARGLYYAAHDHSFTGYVERKVMGAGAPPVFHFAWKLVLTDLPRRIAVDDVQGDGALRLVSLNEKPTDPNAGVLTVKKWDGKALATEFTADVQVAADKLAVGRFAGANRPAVILTTDAVWSWNGATYTRKPFAQPKNLLGSTRLKDGSERVLILNQIKDAQGEKMEVKAYRVDLNGQGDGLLSDPIAAPGSNQITWGDMHADPSLFNKMGMPPFLGVGGLIGLWDVRKFGKMFLYQAYVNQDLDVKPLPDDKGNPQFVVKSQSWNVTFRDTATQDPSAPAPGQLYFTPPLSGAVLDIATESLKAKNTPGLLILTSASKDGKGRSLYFFPLD